MRIAAIFAGVLLSGSAPAYPDACDLLSKSDVVAVVGPPVSECQSDFCQDVMICAGWGELCKGTHQSRCTFSLSEEFPEDRDRELKRSIQLAITFAPFGGGDWYRAERQVTASGNVVRDIQGMGDHAFWVFDVSGDWGRLSIYTANAHLYVYVNHTGDNASSLQAALTFAKTALSRLGAE